MTDNENHISYSRSIFYTLGLFAMLALVVMVLVVFSINKENRDKVEVLMKQQKIITDDDLAKKKIATSIAPSKLVPIKITKDTVLAPSFPQDFLYYMCYVRNGPDYIIYNNSYACNQGYKVYVKKDYDLNPDDTGYVYHEHVFYIPEFNAFDVKGVRKYHTNILVPFKMSDRFGSYNKFQFSSLATNISINLLYSLGLGDGVVFSWDIPVSVPFMPSMPDAPCSAFDQILNMLGQPTNCTSFLPKFNQTEYIYRFKEIVEDLCPDNQNKCTKCVKEVLMKTPRICENCKRGCLFPNPGLNVSDISSYMCDSNGSFVIPDVQPSTIAQLKMKKIVNDIDSLCYAKREVKICPNTDSPLTATLLTSGNETFIPFDNYALESFFQDVSTDRPCYYEGFSFTFVNDSISVSDPTFVNQNKLYLKPGGCMKTQKHHSHGHVFSGDLLTKNFTVYSTDGTIGSFNGLSILSFTNHTAPPHTHHKKSEISSKKRVPHQNKKDVINSSFGLVLTPSDQVPEDLCQYFTLEIMARTYEKIKK